MPKKKKLNIINGTVHTGLCKMLSDSYACGKRQIFAKDFAKEWVGYAISLASITFAKESLFWYRYRRVLCERSLTDQIFFDFTQFFEKFGKIICLTSLPRAKPKDKMEFPA